ncbi:DUF7507 domain-containing protein [Tenacibaculum xiamenense]|uniref:DUF7507 domain-containing protein n=1 Tax=Tenacibaculum xiamenense TaxID=1261553 RepID=UPI003894A19C
MRGIVKLCTFLLLMCSQIGFSQSVSLQDGFITPAPLGTVENSGEGIASFKIQETSGANVDAFVFGGQPNVTVTIDLGDYIALKNDDISLITGTSNDVDVLSLFDVTYASGTRILKFTQKADLPADLFEEISFPIIVTQNSSQGESRNGFNGNIAALGTTTNASGNTSFFTYTSGASLDAIKSVVNLPSDFSVGTVINYEIEVTNSGNEEITNIEVTDPGATITSGNPIASLSPGESATVTASYTLTQADIDNGTYSNTATVTGDSPFGTDDVVSTSDAGTDENGNEITDPLTVDGPDADTDPTNDSTDIDLSSGQNPSMTLIKSVTSSGPYTAGSMLTYELVVTNTGTVTLSNIEVADPGATITSGNPIASLAPGASATVMASYTLTQTDIDSGSYSNSATATGDSTTGTDDVTEESDAGTDENGNEITDPLTVDGPDADTDPTNDDTVTNLSGSMTLIKSVTSSGPYDVGSTITYELVVTNTGSVTITNIEVTDPGATITSGNPIASLAAGESATVTASYTLTQADIDTGSYSNTATATGDVSGGTDNVGVTSDAGTDENGNEITDPLTVDGPDADTDPTNDATNLNLTEGNDPSMTMIKSVTSNGPYTAGSTLTYELVVTNTGGVTLTNIEVTDPGATITSGNPIASLAVGESATVTASYTLTQSDIDNGSYSNSAIATGDSPSGTDDVTVESDAGTDENGNEITDPLTVDGPDADTDPTNDDTVINLSGSMTMIKSVTSSGPYSVGDTITYELVVTNTGATTITNIEVTDSGATITSGNPIASLAPGTSATVMASYTITQSDLDNGNYTNTATATGDVSGGTDNVGVTSDAGTDENGDEITDPLTVDGPDADTDPTNDATDIDLTEGQTSSMTLIKSVTSSGPYSAGSTITYELVVTNTGTLTLSNIEVTDPGATIISGNPIASLVPGASATVTAAYTLTQSDLDNGSYSNSATATGDSTTGTDDVTVESDAGTDENGDEISDPLNVDGPDTDTDPTNDDTVLNLSGSMTLIKSVTSTGPYEEAGDVLTYELVVTNTGTVTLTNIEVTDPGATITSGNPIASLEPGASATVFASYTLTESDIASGTYSNSATATGDSPSGTDDVTVGSDAGTDEDGNPISDPLNVDGPDADTDPTNDATDINLDSGSGNNSSMTLIKSVTSIGPYDVGSMITYELVVTNTGQTTLSNIEVTDLGATITSGNPIASLAPGESATVTAQYAVTQLNLDNGSYSNIATATGDSPDGTDDVSVTSDAGTDEFGNTITDPLTVDGPDIGNDPTDDATYLILNTCLHIYNEFSPNGDGVNEYFKIDCITNYPNNTVEIFNRWGNLVFRVEGYNNNTISFTGKSQGRANVRVDEELPTGTYFYMIDLGNGSDVLKGWLYLNR